MNLRDLPLNALRVFVIVAQEDGVAAAADRLHVTHGAISKQIHLLQQTLNISLFRKSGRRLVLTEAGKELADGAGQVFSDMNRLVNRLSRQQEGAKFVVSVVPSFAARWLVPRLESWYAAQNFEIYINATMSVCNLRAGEVDVAVRYGSGQWPGLHAELLLSPEYIPVCAPSLAKVPLSDPGLMKNLRLIHDNSREAWTRWFRLAGLGEASLAGPVYDDFNVVLQAVLSGQGVGLANKRFVQAELNEGRLVQLTPQSLTEAAFYFVCLPERLDEREIQTFRRWLFAEMSSQEPSIRL